MHLGFGETLKYTNFNICPGCTKEPSPKRRLLLASVFFPFVFPIWQTGETIPSINFNFDACFGCSKEPSK